MWAWISNTGITSPGHDSLSLSRNLEPVNQKGYQVGAHKFIFNLNWVSNVVLTPIDIE